MFDFLKKKSEENMFSDINAKKRTDEELRKTANLEDEQPKENTPEEEWIWVEGYKGTDENICCQPRGSETKTQYELNKEFICDDDVVQCGYGFHFCEKLSDVFSYYDLDLKNRFFKVKGLVKEKDYIKMKNEDRKPYQFFSNIYHHNTKLVAKSINLLGELTYDDLKEYINNKFHLIKNKEDYNNCCIVGYKQFAKNNFISQMKEYGFSDLYSLIQFDSIYNNSNQEYIDEFLKQVQAYYEEKISKDLMIYLLEQYKKDLVK